MATWSLINSFEEVSTRDAMDVLSLQEALDVVLPDNEVINHFAKFLLVNSTNHRVEVEIEAKRLLIPVDITIHLLTKALFKEYHSFAFGALKVQVAIGNVQNTGHGVFFADYCFATLYYDDQLRLISVDFHLNMR